MRGAPAQVVGVGLGMLLAKTGVLTSRPSAAGGNPSRHFLRCVFDSQNLYGAELAQHAIENDVVCA